MVSGERRAANDVRPSARSALTIHYSAFCTRRAFTLIEMLVVLGIIGLVMAMSLPMLIPFMRGRKLDHAADVVKSSCLLARSKAIQQKRMINVTLLEFENCVIITDYETIRENTRLASPPKKCCAHYVQTEVTDPPGTWTDADDRHEQLQNYAIERIRTLPEGCAFDLRNAPEDYDRRSLDARRAWTYVFLPTGAVWSLPTDARNDSNTWTQTTYLKNNDPSGPRIVGPIRSDSEANSVTIIAYSMTGQVRSKDE